MIRVYLLSLIFFLAGCSIFSSQNKRGTITITSVPPKADIFLGGNNIGQTPMEIPQSQYESSVQDGFVVVTIKRVSYYPQQVYAPVDGIKNINVDLSKIVDSDLEVLVQSGWLSKANEMTRRLLQIHGLMVAKKLNTAKAELIQFQKDNPNIAASYTLLANIYLVEGNLAEAQGLLNRAINLNSKDATALKLLNMLKARGVSQ